LPALQATRADVLGALRSAASPFAARSRLRATLISAQVALAVVFMIAATLLFRSVRNGAALDLGFDPDSVVVASFDMTQLGYEREQSAALFDELLRRVRASPGVQHAAVADFAPLGARGSRTRVALPGDPSRRAEPAYNGVSEGFLTTIRYPLVRGRDFLAADRTAAPSVVIVNETLARRLWPGEDALSRRLRVGDESVEREVIGVVGDARFTSYGDVAPLVLLPLPSTYGRFLTLHVRTSLGSAEALADIRRVASELEPNVPVIGETLRETTSFRLIGTRIARGVFGIAGVIALLLAAVGLYGLVAYSAQQRMREIGIRVALGASRRAVFAVLVGGAARMTLVGVAAGILLALGASRLIAGFLYGLSPTDPLTYVAVAALLLVMALASGYAAARRGLRVDPMSVLRSE
jgi:predicted permease